MTFSPSAVAIRSLLSARCAVRTERRLAAMRMLAVAFSAVDYLCQSALISNERISLPLQCALNQLSRLSLFFPVRSYDVRVQWFALHFLRRYGVTWSILSSHTNVVNPYNHRFQMGQYPVFIPSILFNAKNSSY
jgi:hypothetical protein